MKKFLKWLREIYYSKKSDEEFIKLKFKKIFGYDINLENPTTFSEKIQWLKLNTNQQKLSVYADKITVKEYIKNQIGEKYIVPTIAFYDDVNDIMWDQLPKSFIIKSNNGSGSNIKIYDKTQIKKKKLIREIKKWLKSKYYLRSREILYKFIQPKILIEKLLGDDIKSDLIDYKFHCFNGNPILIQVDVDRSTNNKKRAFFDLNWNLTEIKRKYSNDIRINRPNNLDEMITISKEIAKNFVYLRVDLYNYKESIYFGEMTFYPSAGFQRYNPAYADEMLGSYLDLTSLVDFKK